jgi:hypothetical protein
VKVLKMLAILSTGLVWDMRREKRATAKEIGIQNDRVVHMAE